MVANFYEGAYPDRHLGAAMRRYVGAARQRDGAAFNAEVADVVRGLGWKAQTEVPVGKILQTKLDRNYGDVDVLAWSAATGRVLIIECKDVQFKKTFGEIAEQLSDFRGEIVDGRRDLLRKHLDRFDLLAGNAARVQQYLGLPGNAILESHLVFRHPVPMQFVGELVNHRAQLHILSELGRLAPEAG